MDPENWRRVTPSVGDRCSSLRRSAPGAAPLLPAGHIGWLRQALLASVFLLPSTRRITLGCIRARLNQWGGTENEAGHLGCDFAAGRHRRPSAVTRSLRILGQQRLRLQLAKPHSPYVNGHGTHVGSSHATNPNNTQMDNYTTRGNVNPYTGAVGTRTPRY